MICKFNIDILKFKIICLIIKTKYFLLRSFLKLSNSITIIDFEDSDLKSEIFNFNFN